MVSVGQVRIWMPRYPRPGTAEAVKALVPDAIVGTTVQGGIDGIPCVDIPSNQLELLIHVLQELRVETWNIPASPPTSPICPISILTHPPALAVGA